MYVCRASAVEAWQAQGPQAALSPKQPLDLGTLFRPAALLNALEQQACRAAGVALGQLQLVSCWPGASLPHAGQPGRLAVQVAGLLLQGALFDGYSLQPVQQVRSEMGCSGLDHLVECSWSVQWRLQASSGCPYCGLAADTVSVCTSQ